MADSTDRPDVELVGSLLQAFAAAGESLEILLATQGVGDYDPEAWYPLSEWSRLTAPISRYADPDPIFTRLGIEQIHSWFRQPSNFDVVLSAEDFIRYQADAAGYNRVVRGPRDQTGTVELVDFEPDIGRATVRDMGFHTDATVRGIFIGGMTIAPDLLFYDVQVRRTGIERLVDIRYVTPELVDRVRGPDGRTLTGTEWRLLRLSAESARSERYWSSINRTLNTAFAELQVLATRDPLTGLLNRREFLRQFEVELARHRRHSVPVSVLFMDLDDFKRVNDRHGHAAGDAVIAGFGALCEEASREHDVFGRIGGEEFAAFLPHTTLDQAVVLAGRILERLRSTPFEAGLSDISITASIGVAEADDFDTVDGVLKVADDRLLEAKSTGRDQIVAS